MIEPRTAWVLCILALPLLPNPASAVECDPGQFSNDNITCANCSANTYCQGGIVTLCPPFSVAPAGSSSISQCICQANAQMVDGLCMCNDGYILDPNNRCALCPANAFCPDQYTVRNCSNHALALPGQSSPLGCNRCPPGYAQNSPTTEPISCRPCMAGYVCPNATIETKCLAGSYAPATGTACVTCGANTYSADGAAVCSACDPQATSPAGSTAPSACNCNPGFYRGGAYQCFQCPGGYACSGNLVQPCDPGTYTGVQQGACLPCAPGTYQDARSASVCRTCPAGASVQRSTPILENLPQITSRSVQTTSANNGLFISMNYIQNGQGANITSWSFWATRAGCVVTPMLFTGTVQTKGVAEGATTFNIVQKGATRNTTSAGPQNFTFMSNASVPSYTAPAYGFSVASNQNMVQTYFGWAFTGAPCMTYDVAGTGQTFYKVYSAGTYIEGSSPSQFNYDGSALASQVWSVGVASSLTRIVNATPSAGSTSILNCLCPDGTQQIGSGQCQGLCPDGLYMPTPTSPACVPCRQGSFCANSNISACPSGFSSLPGASACQPCINPGAATNIQLYTCGLLKTCTPRQPITLGTSLWLGLGTINVSGTPGALAPSTPWQQPSATVLGFILNPASDKPFASVERMVDLSDYGAVGQELAVQFRYQCVGAACPDYLAVDLFQTPGSEFQRLLYITDFTSSVSNWVTIATDFFIVTTDPGVIPPPVKIRFSAQMKVSSCALWLGRFEVVSLGYWQYDDITRLRFLTTDTVDVPRVSPTSGYNDKVPATNLRINGATISVDLTPLITTPQSLTGLDGVAIFPGYSYMATVWATGNGTVILRVNDMDSRSLTFNTADTFQIRLNATRTPTMFSIQTLGQVTIKAPSLTINGLVVGCQPCLPNYWCFRGAFSACPDNSVSEPGAGAQTDCYCIPGYYGLPGVTEGYTPCKLCPIGSFCLGGNHLQVCPNGTKAMSPGATACERCPVDEYCAFGKNTSCPAYSTSPIDSWDVTQCVCDPGYYGTAPDCRQCEPGFYCVNGSRIACTANAVSPQGAYNASQCYCDRGYEGVRNDPCRPCPEASFCWTGIRTACPVNMWSPLRSSFQSNCTCDYGAYPVQVACNLCSAGTYKTLRGTAPCSICGSGTFSTARGAVSSGVCVGCGPGTYSLGAGQYQCQPCIAGKYSTGVSSSSCTSCRAGSYATLGASGCTVCMAGTFSKEVAAPSIGSCQSCALGAWSNANSTACTLCGACWYWKHPAQLYFQPGDQAAVLVNASKNYRFAVSPLDGRVFMAMGSALYTLDLTTGAVAGPIRVQGPSMTTWWFASISTSVLGNYLYVIRNQDVYRVELELGEYDRTYPSRMATCIVEDSTDPTAVVLWIVQPTAVRKVDPILTDDIASYAISGAVYACINPANPATLYVTGSFGIRSLNKATGAFATVVAGIAFTVCQVTPDGKFIMASAPTLRMAKVYSLLNGDLAANTLTGVITGLLFADNGVFVSGIDSLGVYNTTYVSADSRECPEGQYGKNTGMTSASSCTVCGPGNLCPGGPNVTGCAPGTYSRQTGLREQAQCLTCPAGFYCPGATCASGNDCSINPATGVCSGPDCRNGSTTMTCPDGSYSTRTGLSAATECPLCPKGYYCPNATTMVQCPANTYCDVGKHDLSECLCAPGYQCIITKVVHAEVVLQMSVDAFTADLRQKYIAAIAAAAGVDVSLVTIRNVFSVSLPPSGRRLLSLRRNEGWDSTAISIHTVIHQAHLVELQNLDSHLTDQGLPPHHSAHVVLQEEVVQTFRNIW